MDIVIALAIVAAMILLICILFGIGYIALELWYMLRRARRWGRS
jgi:hypothetical protein